MITEFQSERGFKLITQQPKCKMLTVEDYMKWYDIYLIDTDLKVKQVIKELDDGEVEEVLDDNWFSHYITPIGFLKIAKALEAKVDEQSYRAVINMFIEDHYCLDVEEYNEDTIDKQYMPSDELKSEIILR